MKPALSAEEWAENDPAALRDDVLGEITAWGPHALAALCLHGQDFGFGHGDVAELRALAFEFPDGRIGEDRRPNDVLTDLADRLEALLPPKEEP